MKLYSYIIAFDTGLAPNPFWDELTLNVCKPKIRQSASIDDWIIGTGSKNVKTKNGSAKDYSGKLVFAMKVTKKMTMQNYDQYCKENKKKKIAFIDRKDWKRIVGDSIYDFSYGDIPRLRKVLHKEKDKPRDLSGKYTLLSTNFYYFGENAIPIPKEFDSIIKKEQGHLLIRDSETIENFENWLTKKYEANKLYGEPQLQWQINKGLTGEYEILCDI
ncbi:MAG: hypothetical protein J0H29_21870 [Sphingobacteriales bacterium]|nr:hypothetical protein [Sphingobacteriales bacterium]OJY85071.1 MAG: hypothetical protein BGP14_04295 [Sphingobacteriales bacterium 44-15]